MSGERQKVLNVIQKIGGSGVPLRTEAIENAITCRLAHGCSTFCGFGWQEGIDSSTIGPDSSARL